MTIKVNQAYDIWGTPVRVWIDGVCNHADTEEEAVENYSGIKGYIKYCVDCNAEYNDYDERWENTSESYEDR